MRKIYIAIATASIGAGMLTYGLTADASTRHHVPVYQRQIIQYEFTYHRDGTLVAVTIQDQTDKITNFPCSPPAVDEINGNYSISCFKQ